ncbi:MAG TPA: hypothetical protein VMV46_19485 [Thermoanaerobaculia bacterium]|nr:hypothetical protein [Thermoanaerobaculia bacterium]
MPQQQHLALAGEGLDVGDATHDVVSGEGDERSAEIEVVRPHRGGDVDRLSWDSASDHCDPTDDHRWRSELGERASEGLERGEQLLVGRPAHRSRSAFRSLAQLA